jgi:hypothetical protein
MKNSKTFTIIVLTILFPFQIFSQTYNEVLPWKTTIQSDSNYVLFKLKNNNPNFNNYMASLDGGLSPNTKGLFTFSYHNSLYSESVYNVAGYFRSHSSNALWVENASNSNPTARFKNLGDGSVLTLEQGTLYNGHPLLNVTSFNSSAARFDVTAAVGGNINTSNPAVLINSHGTRQALKINCTDPGPVLGQYAIDVNTNNGGLKISKNDLNGAPAMEVNSEGQGLILKTQSGNIEAEVLNPNTIIGPLYKGINNGLDRSFIVDAVNPNNNNHAFFIQSQGGQAALRLGGKAAGAKIWNLSSSTLPTLDIANAGTGITANFYQDMANNSNPTVKIYNLNGSGPALEINKFASGVPANHNLAIFQFLNSNKIRFDGTGKGFFNGGTQNSGADIAEAFEVEGDVNNYEPGDVLEISIHKNRAVVKSSIAYSEKVLGIYATKPGVLLTEQSIDDSLSNHIPLGVLGVIPTKVCNEGGPVNIGDLLVTSNTKGYCMKADKSKVQIGQVIGKALQSFEGEKGVINVFVNIR